VWALEQVRREPASRVGHPQRERFAAAAKRDLDALRPDGEIKFVIADRSDYEWARETVRSRDLTSRHAVLFSPVFGELEYEDLASWILEDGLPVRLQIQLHKHIWDPARRGV